jgi:hypothetical protein
MQSKLHSQAANSMRCGDTCGENIAELGLPLPLTKDLESVIPDEYASGPARASLGRCLCFTKSADLAGFKETKITLSSASGTPLRFKPSLMPKRFWEKSSSILYWSAYEPCRMATMDLVAVVDPLKSSTIPYLQGRRGYCPNPKLELLLGASETKVV